MAHAREQIIYGVHPTSVGEIVLAKSALGLCWLGFTVKGYKGDGMERMLGFYPMAQFVRDDVGVKSLKDDVLTAWQDDRLSDIMLDLRGTDFQKAVWMALLNIPKGRVCSYRDIAVAIGRPKAVRAVGTAVGSNPVSLVVPCHRVVQSNGKLGNYGWGLSIKQALLEQERALSDVWEAAA